MYIESQIFTLIVVSSFLAGICLGVGVMLWLAFTIKDEDTQS